LELAQVMKCRSAANVIIAMVRVVLNATSKANFSDVSLLGASNITLCMDK